jgi:hypothetical protein
MKNDSTDDRIDRCNIFHEPDEVLHEFKRSLPDWPQIVGYLLAGGAQPEKVTIDVVWQAALEIDSFAFDGNIAAIIDRFGLREVDFGIVQKQISQEAIELHHRFFKELQGNEQILYELPPRMFESIVARLLENMGCKIELTPATRDGGRDILATFQTPLGEILALVECKRYRPDRKIGIDLLERFMWVLDRKDNASFGLMVTTSFFSAEANALARSFQYRIKLRDFEGIREWVAQYGSWSKSATSEVWFPSWWAKPSVSI